MKETTPVQDPTEVGSYFVANYPPFSVWTGEAVEADARTALERAPLAGVPLGMYLHIPFCRKRCHFCYFRVYTDKNAQEVNDYLDVLVRELELYSDLPAIRDRPIDFVYFGGGTPSFLSSTQLEGLVSRLTSIRPWTGAEEVTFECEPGTLTGTKLSAIREMGVTRLSLGVENFDDRILELNGRAHRSGEVYRAWEQARALEFPKINIDLIAGMLGESDSTWRHSVEEALALSPDSITIYQMELPFNTTISGDILKGTGQFSEPVANWATKRGWVREAFEALEAAGYSLAASRSRTAAGPSRAA
jgi:oxygen-independent coproporphyrinogen-3 oxidase